MKKKIIRIVLSIILLSVVIIVGFFTVFYFKFRNNQERYVDIKPGKERSIVFVNVGEKDRGWIADRINEVNVCNPKLIGIDIFFKEYDSLSTKDSLLIMAIKKANCVLGTRHRGIGTHGVHPAFLKAAKNYGYAEMMPSRGGFMTHYPVYYERSGHKRFHFACVMAQMIDSLAAEKFLEKLTGNESDIVISKLHDQFEIIEINEDISCDLIEDKLVIFGYVGPSDEDKKKTYARFFMKDFHATPDQPDTYGPVIVANEVLMILDMGNQSQN
jgi:CHASE2 domain-containing sensor protein